MFFFWPNMLPAKNDWLTGNLVWYMDSRIWETLAAPVIPVFFLVYLTIPEIFSRK